MLQIKNLDIQFESKLLFMNFNLIVNKGDKVCLKARSGYGKSTLLNIIMGFNNDYTGEVFFGGKKLGHSTINQARRQMYWLPQNTDIIGNGTVASVINKPFHYSFNKNLTPDKLTIVKSLNELNLNESILKNDFRDISAGEKQRIGLITGKLLKRNLILLDEPTSALDSESTSRAIDFILRDDELTVLSASHDDRWVEACTTIIDLENDKF
jgi:putative ABC transport system ATP-binding protein